MLPSPQLQHLERWFTAYVDRFPTGLPDADLEVQQRCAHTWRVVADLDRLAADLGLDAGGRRLATALGLLHDTGRFEQFRRHRICLDRITVDHGRLGARILHREEVLTTLPRPVATILAAATALHNRCHLPPGLGEPLARWIHLLRDADKLDILGHTAATYLQGAPLPPGPAALDPSHHLTPMVLHPALAGVTVPLAKVRTVADFFLVQMCWLGDLRYAPSRRLARSRGLLRAFLTALPRSTELDRLGARLLAA